jgi:hypothetical protein
MLGTHAAFAVLLPEMSPFWNTYKNATVKLDY